MGWGERRRPASDRGAEAMLPDGVIVTTTVGVPVVRLGHPVLAGGRPLDFVLELVCSDCGELDDWADVSPDARARLGVLARAHSDDEHDGLVAAEGWIR